MDDFEPQEDTLFLIAAEMGFHLLGDNRKDPQPASAETKKSPAVPPQPSVEKPYSQLT